MPEGEPRTIVEARALSTSLMADLIADRIADATAKYTTTKRDHGLISANTSAFQTILKLCGRQLDSDVGRLLGACGKAQAQRAEGQQAKNQDSFLLRLRSNSGESEWMRDHSQAPLQSPRTVVRMGELP
jgi:hypothetical protein